MRYIVLAALIGLGMALLPVTAVTQPCSGSVGMTAPPLPWCTGQDILFSNTSPPGGATSYYWEWGDGAFTVASTTAPEGHTYNTPGDYTVRLIRYWGNDPCDTAEQVITINAMPQPNITGSSSVCANAITVYSTASHTGYTWVWSVTGGAITAGAGTNQITVTWGGAGAGSVSVTESNNGCTSNDTHGVTIHTIPTADFSFTPAAAPCATQAITFTNTSTPASGLTYLWNFGDPSSGAANTSTLKNPPAHTFLTDITGSGNKTFNVKLIVTQSGGCQDSITKTVTIKRIPDATLTASPSFTQCASGNTFDITVFYSPAGTPSNSGYTIDWGDGSAPWSVSGSAFPPAGVPHTYTGQDAWNLIFTVTGTNGCVNTRTYTVFNGNQPSIGFGMNSNTTGCVPYVVSFNTAGNAGNPTGTYYVLIPGDGSDNDTIYDNPPPNPVYHTYDTPSCGTGTNAFTATWKSINPCQTRQITVDGIVVNIKPGAFFTSPDYGCTSSTVVFTNQSTAGCYFGSLVNENTKFVWYFGDGTELELFGPGGNGIAPANIASQGSATHTYANPGTYTVTLKAFNASPISCGDSLYSVMVCIRPTPTTGDASFTTSATGGCTVPLSISTTNTSTLANSCGDLVYNWSVQFQGSSCVPSVGGWHFQNGWSDSTATNPTIIFEVPGVYWIILRAWNTCGSDTARQTIIVKASPTVTIAPIADICAGETVDPYASFVSCNTAITGYSWSFPGGSPASYSGEDPPPITYGTPGTYTITATATNECGEGSDTETFNVGTPPDATATPASEEICSGETTGITLSSSMSGTTFAWTAALISGTATGFSSGLGSLINQTLYTTGTVNAVVRYTVTPSNNGCPGAPITVDITIKPLPLVSASPVTNQTICSGEQTSITLTSNVAGATISFTAALTSGTVTGFGNGTGTSIAQTLANPGTTIGVVTYTFSALANGCTGPDSTVTVTVNPVPDLTVNPSAGETICSGETTNLVCTSSTPGATYSWSGSLTSGTVIGFSSGTGSPVAQTLTNTSSLPGVVTYRIIARHGNCNGDTLDIPVTVNPLPLVWAGPDVTIPPGTSTSFTAATASGGTGTLTYSWTPADSINPPASASLLHPTTQLLWTTNTFTLTVTDGASCQNSDQILVNVTGTGLSATISATPTSICIGDTVHLLVSASGGSGSYTYLWSSSTNPGYDSTTLNPTDIPTVTGNTTYTVEVYDGFTTISRQVTVPVYPLPTPYTLQGGGEYCAGGAGAVIWLDDSDAGVTYYLHRNGGAGSVSTATGDGDSLSFGYQTLSGTYTASALNAVTTCTNGMTGSVQVTINPVPSVNAGPDQTIFYGTPATLHALASGGTGTLTYQWVPVDSIATGATSTDATTVYLHASTLFGFTATDTKGCSGSDEVLVTVNGSALQAAITASDTVICYGESVTLQAHGSGGTGSYTYDWSCTTPGCTLTSTSPTVIVTPTETSTYCVEIFDGYNYATACKTITVIPLPVAYTVTGGGPYCTGDSGAIVRLENSQMNVSYTLWHAGSPTAITISGDGSEISFGYQSAPGSYYARGTNTLTGCTGWMSDTVYVSILPLPLVFNVGGGGAYPAGDPGGVSITLSGSQLGVEYELLRNDTVVAIPRKPGTGNPLEWANITPEGTYTVRAFSLTSPPCEMAMTGSAVVVINPWPALFSVFGGGGVCVDDPVGDTIGLDGSESVINYQLYRDGMAVGPVEPGTGDTLIFGLFNTPGTYTVTGTNPTSVLTLPMTGSATIFHNPLPTVYLVDYFGNGCPGTEIILNGSDTGTTYTLLRDLNPVDTLPGTGTALHFGEQEVSGIYQVFATMDATGCDTLMDGSVIIHPNPHLYTIYPPGINCVGDTIRLNGSQTGVLYQLLLNNALMGTQQYGTGFPLSFGPQYMSGDYTILAIDTATNCAILMTGTTTLHALPTIFAVVPDGDTCSGATIGLTGSQSHVKYILRRDNVWIDTIPGTGSPVAFGPQTLSGIYTILAFDTTTANLCDNLMLGSCTILSGPTEYPLYPSAIGCSGDTIYLGDSDLGIDYQLIRNGWQYVDPPKPGTGSLLSFGMQTVAGSYTVIATDTTTGCWATMAGTAILSASPQAYNVVPSGDTCAAIPVGVNGSEVSAFYILLHNNMPFDTMPGTGSSFVFTKPVTSGTYTVMAINNAFDSCATLMAGSLTIHPSPAPFVVYPSGVNCEPADVYILFSEAGVAYELIKNGLPTGEIKPGNGGQVLFPDQTSGIYTIVGTSVASPYCQSLMTGSAVISPRPVVDAGPDATICFTEPLYTVNGTATFTSTLLWSTSGDGIFLDPGSLSTTYTPGPADRGNGLVMLALTAQGTPECPGSSDTDTLLLFINPIPVANAGPDLIICENETPLIAGDSLHAGTIYWNSTGDGSFSGNTLIQPVYTPGILDILNGSAELILTVTGRDGCDAETAKDTMALTIHPLPTAHIAGSASICELDTAMLSFTLTGNSPWTVQYSDGSVTVTIDNILVSPHTLPVYPATTTTYTLVSVTDAHCTGTSLTGSVLIEVFPIPEVFTIFASGNGGYCQGGAGVEIGLDGSEPTVKYRLLKEGIPIVNFVTGTGDSITFGYLTQPGVYTVTATDTTSPNLCSRVMDGTVNLVVYPLPDVGFGVDSTCLGQASLFTISGPDTANIVSWYWEFGDGTTAWYDYPEEPAHQYATTGLFQAILTATDSNGCVRVSTHQAVVLTPPVALFNATTPVCRNEPVTFTDFSFSLPAVSTWLTTWIWDFGDGSADTIYHPANPGTTHSYSQAGTFTVTLTVISNIGCISENSTTVTILPQPLSNFSTSSLCEDQLIFFTDISQTNGGGTIMEWAWNFGDPASGSSNTSTLQNPTHQYSAAGNYTVVLVTTNIHGCTDTLIRELAVALQAVADFSADTACLGSLTTFTDTSIPNATSIVSYTWTFGDGSPAVTGQGPIQHLYTLPGIYQATLQIVNSNGCVKDTVKPVTVSAPPTAAFITNAPQCIGSAVAFDDQSFTSHGSITTWIWEFGDGNTTTVQYPNSPDVTHIYTTSGNFQATLTVITTDSCQASKTNTVTIRVTPMANFIYPTANCSLTPVPFTDISQPNGGGPVTQWLWDFDDPASGVNNTSTLQNPSHIFSSGGTFDVTLISFNAVGCSDTISKPVAVEDNPVAGFTADTACLGNATSFTDLSTTPTGTIVAWDWNFGDGTPHSAQQHPVHLYALPGTYQVTLSISNSTGCLHDTTKTVVVQDIPEAMFSYSNGCMGSPTGFTDETVFPSGTITAWFWDFGDGNTSTEQNPFNTYTTTGTFQVELMVTTDAGCQDSITLPVTIHLGPTAGYSYHSYYCPAGQVNFTDLSTGNGAGITGYEWTFEPGFTSSQPNPTYFFTVFDTTYVVTLTVTDQNGCTDTITDSVYVKPAFAFAMTSDSVCLGLPTQFHAINLAPGDSLHFVRWNFGEPASGAFNTSTAMNPQHTYGSSGTFLAKLTAWNSENCMDSIYQEVIVHFLPQVAFTATSIPCDSNVYFTDETIMPLSEVASWSWNFGDGSPVQVVVPPASPDITHVFSLMGFFFDVTLTVTSMNGCTDSITVPVQRFPCISAAMALVDTLVCEQDTTFMEDLSAPVDLISNWEWSFGDGSDTTYGSFSLLIPHRFPASGQYTVTLVVTINSLGTNIYDTNQMVVTVKPRPQALFTAPITCLNDTTRFTNLSVSPVTDSLSYTWHFGDPASGTGDTSTWPNPAHHYDQSGFYLVSLATVSLNGCSDSIALPVQVNALPEAAFASTIECVNHPVWFSDQSVTGDTTIAAWWWNFGDQGTVKDTSVLQHPVYTYDSVRPYTITLRITDATGCTDTVAQTIAVKPAPLSEFTLEENYEKIAGQVLLHNFSSGATRYYWDFGNGATGEEEEPVVKYTQDGTYTIWLVSYNSQGCYDSVSLDYTLLFRGLFVPNAFVPGGHVPELRLFKPVGINLIQYHIRVFDKWGHLMWESTALDKNGAPMEGWDGTWEGASLPQGTYMWKISAEFEDGTVWQGSDIGKGEAKAIGTVSLIR